MPVQNTSFWRKLNYCFVFSRTSWVRLPGSRYQKDEPFWVLQKPRWWGGSGISWAICKSFAPRCRQSCQSSSSTQPTVVLFSTVQSHPALLIRYIYRRKHFTNFLVCVCMYVLLGFYTPDALPAFQPLATKHSRQTGRNLLHWINAEVTWLHYVIWMFCTVHSCT